MLQKKIVAKKKKVTKNKYFKLKEKILQKKWFK